MGIVPRDNPPVEMTSPRETVRRVACNPDWTSVANTELPWVYTCGLVGPVKLRIRLGPPGTAPSPYRVVLHFCELKGKHAPSGPFTVKLQDKAVFRDIHVRHEAGGVNRAMVKETAMAIGDTLSLAIVPAGTSAPLFTGLEVIAR